MRGSYLEVFFYWKIKASKREPKCPNHLWQVPNWLEGLFLLDVIEDRRFGSSRMRAWCIVELQNASVAHSGSTILDDVDEK